MHRQINMHLEILTQVHRHKCIHMQGKQWMITGWDMYVNLWVNSRGGGGGVSRNIVCVFVCFFLKILMVSDETTRLIEFIKLYKPIGDFFFSLTILPKLYFGFKIMCYLSCCTLYCTYTYFLIGLAIWPSIYNLISNGMKSQTLHSSWAPQPKTETFDDMLGGHGETRNKKKWDATGYSLCLTCLYFVYS